MSEAISAVAEATTETVRDATRAEVAASSAQSDAATAEGAAVRAQTQAAVAEANAQGAATAAVVAASLAEANAAAAVATMESRVAAVEGMCQTLQASQLELNRQLAENTTVLQSLIPKPSQEPVAEVTVMEVAPADVEEGPREAATPIRKMVRRLL